MARYQVLIPITGYISVEVEADSEDQARETAFESEDLTLENIQNWECHEKVVQGNVCYAVQNEIEVELID